jgi:hypothetical protein
MRRIVVDRREISAQSERGVLEPPTPPRTQQCGQSNHIQDLVRGSDNVRQGKLYQHINE